MGFTTNLGSEHNNLKLSVADPGFEKRVKNTIVNGRLTLTNISKGLLTKLTSNLAVILNINSICVLDSELTLEDFHSIFRCKNVLNCVEFQKVSIFPVISFSDALKLAENASHVQ